MHRPNIVIAEKEGTYVALFIGDDLQKAEAVHAKAIQDSALDAVNLYQSPYARLSAYPKAEALQRKTEEAARKAKEKSDREAAHIASAQEVAELKEKLEKAEAHHKTLQAKPAKA